MLISLYTNRALLYDIVQKEMKRKSILIIFQGKVGNRMISKRIKAVFFDLDGVLVNSEIMHQKMTEDFLKEENIPIPPERFYLLIGSHKSLNPWAQIMKGLHIDMNDEELKQHLHAYKAKRLAKVNYKDHLFPETKAVLTVLKEKKIQLACASSSNMNYIKAVLDSDDLTPLFDLIVTCDDFEKSKPEPDIYLYCLKHFGFAKEECLIVEDSEIGIQAGKSAGMKVIARKDHMFHLNQDKADAFIEDLNGLLDFII